MARTYRVGSEPPQVIWTIVRGDTAAFRVYVTDDAKDPLNIPDWNIKIDFERFGQDVFILYPEQTSSDKPGEFTVAITAEQSQALETDDVFDIQLSDDTRVWTVAQGKMFVIEDVTEPWEES
jgi:hypothetical protein